MKKKRKVISILLLIIFAGFAFGVFFVHPPACEIDPKSLSYYPYSLAPTAPTTLPAPPVLPVINVTYGWPLRIGYDIFLELERSGLSWDSHFCFGKVALRTYFTDTLRADVCPICSSIRLLGPSLQVFVR
jgi:hypothetical protein